MVFLDDSIDLDSLSRQLISGVCIHSDELHKSKPWTNSLLRDGLQLLKTQELHLCCCHGAAQDGEWPQQGEWLLDLVWMDRRHNRGNVESDWRIVLAVESELAPNPAAIEEDFGKLMSIKAHHKLFFFRPWKQMGAADIVKAITSMMEGYPYHIAGEEYMVIAIAAQGAFRYWFKVPADGHLKTVEFKQMGTPLPWPWSEEVVTST
jgi:hypothetical protein